ncbi:MAG: hypothetical protein EBU90_15980 [Proteobacteria bacterium]|nr:hypothetical protein [Pseudomonadota bacterium]
MNTRAIIDYAIQDDAAGLRDALYAEIQDRVHTHIEMKKQEIAGSLIAQEDSVDATDGQIESEE